MINKILKIFNNKKIVIRNKKELRKYLESHDCYNEEINNISLTIIENLRDNNYDNETLRYLIYNDLIGYDNNRMYYELASELIKHNEVELYKVLISKNYYFHNPDIYMKHIWLSLDYNTFDIFKFLLYYNQATSEDTLTNNILLKLGEKADNMWIREYTLFILERHYKLKYVGDSIISMFLTLLLVTEQFDLFDELYTKTNFSMTRFDRHIFKYKDKTLPYNNITEHLINLRKYRLAKDMIDQNKLPYKLYQYSLLNSLLYD